MNDYESLRWGGREHTWRDALSDTDVEDGIRFAIGMLILIGLSLWN